MRRQKTTGENEIEGEALAGPFVGANTSKLVYS